MRRKVEILQHSLYLKSYPSYLLHIDLGQKYGAKTNQLSCGWILSFPLVLPLFSCMSNSFLVPLFHSLFCFLIFIAVQNSGSFLYSAIFRSILYTWHCVSCMSASSGTQQLYGNCLVPLDHIPNSLEKSSPKSIFGSYLGFPAPCCISDIYFASWASHHFKGKLLNIVKFKNALHPDSHYTELPI